jgi:predicted AlkP superfamily pyrophosphatase or phosphodiesterase
MTMHIRTIRWLLPALLLLSGGAASARSLLLISLDGLPPRYVTDADTLKLRIPNLRGFVSGGTYADGVVGVLPTLTYPNHTTIVSGVLPERHGILSNTPFDPLLTNREGWYWYAEDIRVPTLWSAAHAAGMKTATVNWPVTVGDENIDTLLPEFWRVSNADDLKLLRALARPEGRIAQLEKKLGPFVDGNTDTLATDETRTRFALEVLRNDKPNVMGVHLIALDGTEHHEGPYTAPVFEVLEALDRMVGELSTAALANDPAATIAVVSDHGFIETHTSVNLRARFVEAGLIKLTSPNQDGAVSVASWDAQIWPAGGVAAVKVKDAQSMALRQRVRAVLDAAAADSRNGIALILGPSQFGPSGGFPGAVYVVEFAPGFVCGTALRGDLLTPSPSKGTHGYMPEREEMHASFFIKGKDIAAGRDLGVVEMLQIAPTLAKVLAIDLPTARAQRLPIFSSERLPERQTGLPQLRAVAMPATEQ